MFVFSPKPYGSAAIWPTYITTGNPAQTSAVANEQAWEQRGLVTIPPFGLAPGQLPPYYGQEHNGMRTANRYGMGDTATQVVQTSASAASGTLAIPAVQSALGISAAAASFATLGIGAAAMGVIMWLNRKGPKQKVASTHIVDEAEPILKQNVDAFLAGPKTNEAKEYALAVFNKVWASVVAACSDPSLGNPGKACVADRQRGGKWDWFSYYYDPIANTATQPETQLAVQSIQEQVGATLSPVLGSNWEVLLGGALVLLAGVSLLGDN